MKGKVQIFLEFKNVLRNGYR